MNGESSSVTDDSSRSSGQDLSTKQGDVRLWPAVVILIAQASVVILPGILIPGSKFMFLGMFLGLLAGLLAFLIWWLAASRAPWVARGIIFLGFIGMCIATAFLMDPSMGYVLFMYAVPFATAAWVAVLALTRGWPWRGRTPLVLLSILVVLSSVQPFRQEGADGTLRPKLVLRWQPRQEDAVLEALREYEGAVPRDAILDTEEVLEVSSADWAEFRGPRRDGRVFGVQIDTDWSVKAPVEIWRRPVGPGWASFAVVGTRAYTQEQRGENEAVVCYDTANGREIWAHVDRTKFDEAMSGVGPRATPTVAGGRLYALGGKGKLNCLNPVSGQPLWTADIAADTGVKVPEWGFASSPLVVGDLVVVYAGAPGAGMIAYDRESGETAWTCPAGTHGYSSPHVARIEETDLLLMMSNAGLTAAEVTSGSLLWEYAWPSEDQARIVQPAVLEDGDILVATGYGYGTHRVSPMKTGDDWKVETVWESRNLKPYFNDFVEHKGLIYGFDDKIMTCVEPATGDRVWKGGRYGYGQLVLLADQDVLLVLSEKGDVALVEAKPDDFRELAKFHALDGKTWNHPVVAYGKLFVRNAEEAVCYELSVMAQPEVEMLAVPEE